MADRTIHAPSHIASGDRVLTTVKWTLILLLAVVTVTGASNIGLSLLEPVGKMLIAAMAWIHGTQRYGTRNMLVWLGITWLVSNFFEALSIQTGFPYGNYHYEIPGPRIFNVPILIMPSYFGLGYLAWTLAQILTAQYNRRLAGSQLFGVPLIAALIMTMYDVVTDPVASTVNSHWIWHAAGAYFGVPLTNFAGWIFVGYVFNQIFALFISRPPEDRANRSESMFTRAYWFEPVLVYSIMGAAPIIQFLARTDRVELFGSLALISVFTLIFVALLSFITLLSLNDFGSATQEQARATTG